MALRKQEQTNHSRKKKGPKRKNGLHHRQSPWKHEKQGLPPHIHTQMCVCVYVHMCSNSNDDVQESVYDSPSLASGESGNSGVPVRRD